MKLEEVFKNIDNKLLENTEFQTQLQEAVDVLVQEKSETKAKELFEAREEEYIQGLNEQLKIVKEAIVEEQKEKFNEAVEVKVKEIAEAYGNEIKEEAETKLQEEVDKLSNEVKMYVNHAVAQFVEESAPVWQQEIDVMKANKIMESFTGMAQGFIGEMVVLTADEKLEESNKALEESIHSIKSLKEELIEMKKDKMISEAVKGLTAPQTDKFNSLIESVEFISESDFDKKIKLYKSALGDSVVVENKIESKPSSSVPSWKR